MLNRPRCRPSTMSLSQIYQRDMNCSTMTTTIYNFYYIGVTHVYCFRLKCSSTFHNFSSSTAKGNEKWKVTKELLWPLTKTDTESCRLFLSFPKNQTIHDPYVLRLRPPGRAEEYHSGSSRSEERHKSYNIQNWTFSVAVRSQLHISLLKNERVL